MVKGRDVFAEGLSKEALSAVSDGIEVLRRKDKEAHRAEMKQAALRAIRGVVSGFPHETKEAVFEEFADQIEPYAQAVRNEYKYPSTGHRQSQDMEVDVQKGLRRLLGVPEPQ